MMQNNSNSKYQLSISVVLYETKPTEVKSVIKSISKTKLSYVIFLIDNSPTDLLKNEFIDIPKLEYIYTNENLGFGSGHNIAIEKAKSISEYHLVLNADVHFEGQLLEEIYDFMSQRKEVGLLAPKIFNPDGTVQYSVKLLPTPTNLIVRRFIPLKWLQNKMNRRYELRFFSFDKIIEIPYAMGCFMFIRCEVFQKISGFDERFFMYPEDIDLTRRIHEHYKTIYYPKVTIIHEHGRGSYKDKKLLYYHITSMIKYFNKWGWLMDRKRRKVNRKILKQFKQ